MGYPIFEKVYGKVALRGKDDVKVLCNNFARKSPHTLAAHPVFRDDGG